MKAKFLYIVALAVIVLDQITKYLAETRLPQGISMRIIGRLLAFTAVHNRGGAFGVLQSWTGILSVVSVGVILVIMVFLRRRGTLPALISFGLALQLGGAAGNLIDRVRLGYVVDFIDFGWWPVFNIADSAIAVGIVMLAYYLLFVDGRKPVELEQTRISDVPCTPIEKD